MPSGARRYRSILHILCVPHQRQHPLERRQLETQAVLPVLSINALCSSVYPSSNYIGSSPVIQKKSEYHSSVLEFAPPDKDIGWFLLLHTTLAHPAHPQHRQDSTATNPCPKRPSPSLPRRPLPSLARPTGHLCLLLLGALPARLLNNPLRAYHRQQSDLKYLKK